jgi:quercetin dioxygenase-like cupin family protein
MPFYRISEMEEVQDLYAPTRLKQVAGELIKVGIVTLQIGEEPPPHFHPNEEQFNFILEGKIRMLLGREIRVIEPGYLVHIPRNTTHALKILEGPMVFVNCKSPVGSGELSLDYNEAPNAAEIREQLVQGIA